MELLTHTSETPVKSRLLKGLNMAFLVDKYITRNTKLELLFRTFVVGLVVFQQSFLKNLHNSQLCSVYKGFGLPRPLFFSINNQLTLRF